MKDSVQLTMVVSVLLLVSCGTPKNKEESNKEIEVEEIQEVQTTTPDLAGKVFFVEPADGASVSSPVHVVMGVGGMEIEPAGEVNEGKGHHHVLINDPYVDKGVVVPTDETHIHFGKGQTETDLELEPGEYTLTLQFADGLHQSYGESMSASITVVVE